MSPRVVVSGAGAICSIGAGIDAFSEALFAGKCGLSLSSLAAPGRETGVPAFEVAAFAPEPWLGNKGIRVLDRSARLLCVAAQMALSGAGMATAVGAEHEDATVGLVCGTMFGSVHSITAFDWSGLTEGAKYVNPMDFPNTVINSPAGQAAIRFKLRGVNSTISSGLASGLYAIHYAAEFLRLGRASALLAGGVEELCEESYLGFAKNGLISSRGSVRPFASDRDGTVPGEGSGLWLMETEEHALGRGSTPMLEVCGFGCAYDARSTTAYDPHATGAAAAMRQALEASGISAQEVALVVASAAGSRIGDRMEARALHAVLGSRAADIPVCAPKASFGEALGASGALLALAAGAAIASGQAPPTAGFLHTDEGLRLSALAQPSTGEFALVNAFGCDGNNASLVVRRYHRN